EVVLEERRLELAFEAHRSYDLYRNNLPLVRAYPGVHGSNQFDQTILPASNRIIHFIPEREIGVNPKLEQNP
ncbi:MAG TPA: RagB/SusD family nutrient uptake outer membrane protein, partial [Chitinophaga sp.]